MIGRTLAKAPYNDSHLPHLTVAEKVVPGRDRRDGREVGNWEAGGWELGGRIWDGGMLMMTERDLPRRGRSQVPVVDFDGGEYG